MDKSSTCAYVASILKNINRDRLNQEFSKFGRVTKIFIEPDHSSAKVYLDTVEGVNRACPRLNGIFGWEVSLFKSELRGPPKSTNTENIHKAMEFVDVHGKPLEVVEDEEGRIFVSLKDIKASGFYVFEKNLYSQCELPKSMDLQQFELFLLNQGKNYILNHKKNFNESEILNVLQRVEMALINKSEPVQNNFECWHSGLVQSLPANTQNYTHPKDYQNNHSTAPQGGAGNRRPPNRNFTNDNRWPNQGPQNHQNSNRNCNENYSQKKNSWIPAGVITFDDMGFVQLETGINTYVAYSCTGETAALIPMSEEVMEHFATMDNINPKDNQPYKADLLEMCVAKFNDVWYRGMVTDIKNDGVREILFVDYGNSEDVNVADIRHFSKDLKDIPILSVTAQFEGIPDKTNVHERIKELIPDQTLLEVNVTEANAEDMEFLIQVPSVYNELKKEGLM